ncbi:hypothetical protein HW44_03385 [Nitrosococcus oceani]|nr:hypothetical protein HW44_03385 [Nitrosococcus oceani]
MAQIKTPKKLIEVALPLDDINAAAAREKSIRHGHPSTLHLWWARRPLAAARAVLFAQLVNDPGYQRDLGFGVNKKEAEIKREKLFQIIRDLVKWENTNNEEVLNRAREAIRESWRETCHQMIRRLNNQGESAAGELLAKMPEKGEPIRQLAYHLYTLCERKKWAEEARAYNELIGSWHAIVTASHEVGHSGSQTELGLDF